MLLPAEIESKTLIPALRAIIAKNPMQHCKNLATRQMKKTIGVARMN